MHLKLVDILDVESNDHLILLGIRNETKIRNNMFSKEVIPLNKHLEWVKDLSNSIYRKVFYIYANDLVIGAIGYNLIETNINSCSWSIYISEKSRILGLASYLEFSFLDYLFYKKNVNVVYADVLNSNQVVLNLHKKFGFEIVSQQESTINTSHEFSRISIDKQSWDKKRILLIKKFASFFNKFILEIIEG